MIVDKELIDIILFFENIGYKVLDIYSVKDEIYVFTDRKVEKKIFEVFRGKKIFVYYFNGDVNEIINRYFYNIFRKLPRINSIDGKIVIEHKISSSYLYKFEPLIKFLKKITKKDIELIWK